MGTIIIISMKKHTLAGQQGPEVSGSRLKGSYLVWVNQGLLDTSVCVPP